MNDLMVLALCAGCYVAVARGWFLALAGAFAGDFDLDDVDVAFCLFISALIALLWPITGTLLALFVAARRIVTFGGERTLADWANDLVKR